MKCLFIMACFAFLCGCGSSGPGDVVGTGSSSPNALNGTVYVADAGNSALRNIAGATVILYAIAEKSAGGYVWVAEDSMLSNDRGNISFNPEHSGYYSMVGGKDGLKFFSGYFYYSSTDSSIVPSGALDTLVLETTQNISGTISDTSGTVFRQYALGLVGSSYHDTTSVNGLFGFDSIPRGEFAFEMRLIDTSHYVTLVQTSSVLLTTQPHSLPPDTVISWVDIAETLPVSGISTNIRYNSVDSTVSIRDGALIIHYEISENK